MAGAVQLMSTVVSVDCTNDGVPGAFKVAVLAKPDPEPSVLKYAVAELASAMATKPMIVVRLSLRARVVTSTPSR